FITAGLHPAASFARWGAGPQQTQNPVPTLASLTPDERQAGSGSFLLSVEGANFVNGARVRWNGVDRPTTFNSSTSLGADIPTADLTNAGSASITVFNPAPGGGVSNALSFTIKGGNTGGETVALASGVPQTGLIPAPQGSGVLNPAQYTIN